MKKILLTGKSGQLGGAIVQYAARFGFEVLAFDKDDLDVRDRAQVRERIRETKPDVFINTAAYHMVPACEENPMDAMDVNLSAVATVAKLCREYGTQFVTYSTDYVFDGEKGSPYSEEDKPNPLQIYGISKLAGEYAALQYHPKGAMVIRTCGLYGGRGGSPEKGGNFVLNIIKAAQEKEVVEVNVDEIVSPTFAGDLSVATLGLIQNKGVRPGIYHLVNEGYCSRYEFTKAIYKVFGVNKKVVPVAGGTLDEGVRRPKFSALENTKAAKMGIVLPSWQEGLRSYMKFLHSR